MRTIHLKSSLAILLTTILFSCGIASKQAQQSDEKKPLVVFVTGDHEYGSEATMPIIAAELEKNYNMRTVVLKSTPDPMSEENIPGLDVLKQADLAIFFLRWRRLPADQLKPIDEYLKSGKPVMGFRTTTHAFNFPVGHASENWNAFGEFAFGTPPGWGKSGHTHYGHESSTDITVIPAQKANPILTGVPSSFHVRSWLYHVLPDYPPKGATSLMMGKAINPNKTAIENPVAWTWRTHWGGKSFFTTMGHPDDFKEEGLQRLVINAVHWTLNKEIPQKWAGKIAMNVPYRQQ
ncbi:hypothetical protein BWD42_07195 [Sphingobacterium sp. CZ-UAM]|uniref:ThuA domain-containing protein n=1 Tax=Sphingobacterium sp. CZ-UAM TaxID=1933868 RepID=UPI0009873E7B|nr:ThuA domain-containing protein [Sphingobacterium sp. CZ-UAM]OOG19684.1 hypothetical protein BWD42_07195 [Sphingobacterium sp. CZ-UAM]